MIPRYAEDSNQDSLFFLRGQWLAIFFHFLAKKKLDMFTETV